MKSVLMIAPASYPVTGAEAIVNIKLLKVLTVSGEFEIDLVSRKYESIDYPAGNLEKYGVKLRSLYTVHVDNKLSLKTVWQHMANYIFLGVTFKGCHWGYAVLPTIKKLLKENKYDYVLTKGEIALPLGYYAKKRGFKWVATWNDPCPASMYPAPYGHGIEYSGSYSDRHLIKMMRKADYHIFPSERLANYMQPIVNAKPSQVSIIPHAVLESSKTRSEMATNELRIIHSGNLFPPRGARTFIEGLKAFVADNDPTLKVCFLGKLHQQDQDLIIKYGLEKYIEYLPPVEYTESLSLLSQYDVALIIEAKCEEGIYLPTKVTDFMQEHIPMFTVSPINGTLHDMHLNGDIPYFANVEDIKSITKALQCVYSDFKNGKIKQNRIPDTFQPEKIVEKYSSF